MEIGHGAKSCRVHGRTAGTKIIEILIFFLLYIYMCVLLLFFLQTGTGFGKFVCVIFSRNNLSNRLWRKGRERNFVRVFPNIFLFHNVIGAARVCACNTRWKPNGLQSFRKNKKSISTKITILFVRRTI